MGYDWFFNLFVFIVVVIYFSCPSQSFPRFFRWKVFSLWRSSGWSNLSHCALLRNWFIMFLRVSLLIFTWTSSFFNAWGSQGLSRFSYWFLCRLQFTCRCLPSKGLGSLLHIWCLSLTSEGECALLGDCWCCSRLSFRAHQSSLFLSLYKILK